MKTNQSTENKTISKESVKRSIELMILGIYGLKDVNEQTFKHHLRKVQEEMNNLIDNL